MEYYLATKKEYIWVRSNEMINLEPSILSEVKWNEVKVTQSCQTLCELVDETVHGILQARILDWVAIPFCKESSPPRELTKVSHIAGIFFTIWTREA